MTKEEKDLLLRDLCARLPYGLKGKVKTTDGNGQKITDDGVINSVFINEHGMVCICIESAEYELEDVKPYLRPMSSMTEEEIKDYYKCTDEEHIECYEVRANGEDKRTIIEQDGYSSAIDLNWLNAHHFDYRGLIEKGLALKAPEGMYKI